MTQRELDRAVAHATGEYVSEISRRGFSSFDPFADDFEPEPIEAPQVVDWDELDRFRQVPFFSPQAGVSRHAA
jgi:hypothetical protein